MDKIIPADVQAKLCRALGIEPDRVVRLSLVMDYHTGIRVEVVRLPTNEQLGTVTELVREHADVIEVIEKTTGTPFPWSTMSVRTTNSITRARARGRADHWPCWPWTCEDLFEIGSLSIMGIKDFGETSANDIAAALDKLGFPDWRNT